MLRPLVCKLHTKSNGTTSLTEQVVFRGRGAGPLWLLIYGTDSGQDRCPREKDSRDEAPVSKSHVAKKHHFRAFVIYHRQIVGATGSNEIHLGQTWQTRFGSFLVQFLSADDGPTAVEYAVMLALILVACISIVTSLGTKVSGTFRSVNRTLSS